MVLKKRKIKKFRGGGMDASKSDFKSPSGNTSPKGSDHSHSRFDVGSGYYGEKVTNTGTGNGGTGTTKTNLPPPKQNTGQKTSFMPITIQIAKKLIFDPLTKHSRTQKMKGESFFGRPKDLPATKDYYRAYGEPIDVMSKKGTDFMKDAGLIKPTKTVPTDNRGENKQQLCPDGTFPPCKTPTTQIKKPVSKPNTFLSGFQAYDDGGEVVISSNVDKSLL